MVWGEFGALWCATGAGAWPRQGCSCSASWIRSLVRRAALLEDPHRVGVRIRHHLLHLEELGEIVRQLRCPVSGIGNEGPAADCEHPGRERRDQAQSQNEPRHACDKLDAGRRMHGLTAIIDGALAMLQSGSLAMVPIAGSGRVVDGRPRPGSDDAAAKIVRLARGDTKGVPPSHVHLQAVGEPSRPARQQRGGGATWGVPAAQPTHGRGASCDGQSREGVS